MLIAILMFVVIGLSWLVTCGIVALACLCFGWEFNWLIGTGIWLICLLLKWIFGGSKE